MGHLRKRSFGMIMLLLALVAMVPGISIVAGLLLMIPAFQMLAGRPAPIFPRRIANRPLPTRHLAALVQRAVVLRNYSGWVPIRSITRGVDPWIRSVT
jgi:hypothetical protein